MKTSIGRQKLVLWALLVLSPALVAEQAPALFPGSKMKLWETVQLAEDVYAFRYTFYRNIFLVSDEGAIATDPLNPEAARILRDEIRRITDQPVRFVAYSHSHWDHASGGQIFKDEGATFISHERCAENLRESPNPGVVPADITFADEYRIELGEQALTLHYFGPAHDNCMVVMHIEPANLLLTVDVANPPNGWTMFYNPAVSEDRVWHMVRFFEGVEDLIAEAGIETVVGAHMTMGMDPETGQPGIIRGTTGPARVVTERREFWQSMIEGVRAELAAGAAPDDIPDRLVEQGYLADRIFGYDAEKMRVLWSRITSYALTGE